MMQLSASASVPAFIATVLFASWTQAQERPTPGAASAPPEPAIAGPTTAPVSPAASPVASRIAPPAAPSAPAQRQEQVWGEEHASSAPVARRTGFYLRVGGGPSVVALNGRDPSGRDAHLRGAGSSGFIAIGGPLAPGFVLAGTLQAAGLEGNFKRGPLDGATLTVNGQTRSASRKATGGFGVIGLLADWYPNRTGGWHAGVATGLGAIALTNAADDRALGGVNLSGSLFGGYDWTLARDWSLGLQLTASGGTQTKLKDENGDHDTGYRLTPLSVGLQASLLYF